MKLTLILLNKSCAMALMAFVGFIISKVGLVNVNESKILSQLVLYVLFPCTLIECFQRTYDMRILQNLSISLLASILIHVVNIVLLRGLRKFPGKMSAAEGSCVMYTNAGSLVAPMIMATLGGEYVIYSCSYLAVQNILMWTHGRTILQSHADKESISLKMILCNPCMLAIAIGLSCFLLRITFPQMVSDTISSMAACIAPISMLGIGILMANLDLKEIYRQPRVYYIVSLRLIIFPLVIICLLFLISKSLGVPDVLAVTLLCAIGPSGTTMVQFAQIFDNPECGLMSSVNIVTTMCCVITMPLMFGLYHMIVY